MKFLSVRIGEHDSNVTYTDGVNIKYFKPERQNQIKHYAYEDIISWLGSSAFLNFKINEIDGIALILDSYAFNWLGEDEGKLYKNINIPFEPFTSLKCPIFKLDHHYAHSLSSWMLTDKSTTDMVLDGFGDKYRTCSVFQNNKLIQSYTKENGLHSFGIALQDFACALKVQGSSQDLSGKIMALQSFGKVDKDYLKYISQFNLQQSNKILDFENYVKIKGSRIVANHTFINFVKTVHFYIENIFPKFFNKYCNSNDVITYSGGVAQNVCINTKLKTQYPNIIIPPHCADEGLSLGGVEFLRKHFEQPKFNTTNFPFWQTDIIPETLPSDQLIKQTAQELAQGKIIGWYQGHGEVGPRALGNRSILMSPEIKDGKSMLNKKVKHREDYRPFAASIKLDKTKDYFDWEGESEFMLYGVKFKDKIFDPIAHIDGTSRIQTVKPNHEYFYKLLDEFEKLTGLPMLLNTSLNDNGKPIAGKPKDAFALLKHSDLDYLIVGDCIYRK